MGPPPRACRDPRRGGRAAGPGPGGGEPGREAELMPPLRETSRRSGGSRWAEERRGRLLAAMQPQQRRDTSALRLAGRASASAFNSEPHPTPTRSHFPRRQAALACCIHRNLIRAADQPAGPTPCSESTAATGQSSRLPCQTTLRYSAACLPVCWSSRVGLTGLPEGYAGMPCMPRIATGNSSGPRGQRAQKRSPTKAALSATSWRSWSRDAIGGGGAWGGKGRVGLRGAARTRSPKRPRLRHRLARGRSSNGVRLAAAKVLCHSRSQLPVAPA